MTYKISEENLPVRIDLPDMVKKADWHWAFQMMDDDNINPNNTTGYTIEMEFKKSQNGEVYDTFALGDGITMTAASGLFNIDLDYATVDSYDWQSAVYKIIVIDDTGGRVPLFIGSIKFAE
jgi:hypothetical protein